MFATGIARGIRAGILPKGEYGDVVNKAWAGLVSPFYQKRYALYADSKVALLSSGDGTAFGDIDEDTVVSNAIEAIVKWNCQFSRERWDNDTLPSVPRGDPLVVARALWTKYGNAV